MNNVIVIAAISSRSYVQAAVNAGFDVIAIDAFADVDTQKLAKKVIQVDVKDGQFHAQQLLQALSQLDLSSCIGFAYGAGFEAQSELLKKIALIVQVIGNSAETVEKCKQPRDFFALCEALSMPYPETVFEKPNNTLGWLQKTIGASGGEHIKPVLPLDLALPQQVYYQRKQSGLPISCLFLADGHRALIIGFNEQWCSPTILSPYRFGGAVSQAALSTDVQDQVTQFIQSITQNLSLKGFNSCDCIVEDNKVFVLEINPRLSASLALYSAKRGDLFDAHMAACLGKLKDWPVVDRQSRAIQIVYANQIAKVPVDMDWPEWVSDIPQPDSVIPIGAPICTVTAQARTAKLAKQKVLQRAASL